MKNELFIKQNGKWHIKAEPVILPTEKKSKLYKLSNSNELVFSANLKKSPANLHLYFLSNEKIEKEDWILCSASTAPTQALKGENYAGNKEWKKIIATTDKLDITKCLYCDGICEVCYNNRTEICRPSNEFLRAYANASGKIDEVLIEITTPCLRRDDGCPFYLQDNGLFQASDEHGTETLGLSEAKEGFEYQLKVAPDNTVTIRECKEAKEGRDKLYKLMNLAYWKGGNDRRDGSFGDHSFNQWFDDQF